MDNKKSNRYPLSTIHYPFSRRLLLTLALILVPASASAATTVWNMEGVSKLEGWNHKGFASIGLTPQGLSMSTSAESQGQLARKSDVQHNVDTLAITYTSPTGADGIFFWQPHNLEGNTAYNIPMQFERAPTPRTVVLDVSQIPEWTPKSKLIGFNINQNAQLTLMRIELSGPSVLDTLYYGSQSIFRFDAVHAYTVNFLWGPRLASSADQVAKVFASVPPTGDSWNKVFYTLLALAGIAALLVQWKTGRNTLPLFLVLLSALWIFYDLRMGAEVLSYAQTDLQTWWSKPLEEKTYRDRGAFTAFTKIAPQFIEETDARYVLLTPSGWPYFTALHYETYPVYPIPLEQARDDTTLWMVFDMLNVSVNDEGRLVKDGIAISPAGDVVFPYDNDSFIFRTRPQ